MADEVGVLATRVPGVDFADAGVAGPDLEEGFTPAICFNLTMRSLIALGVGPASELPAGECQPHVLLCIWSVRTLTPGFGDLVSVDLEIVNLKHLEEEHAVILGSPRHRHLGQLVSH